VTDAELSLYVLLSEVLTFLQSVAVRLLGSLNTHSSSRVSFTAFVGGRHLKTARTGFSEALEAGIDAYGTEF